MESKFYEKDKLLVFKITDEIDECSVQKIRGKLIMKLRDICLKELYLILIMLLSWIVRV